MDKKNETVAAASVLLLAAAAVLHGSAHAAPPAHPMATSVTPLKPCQSISTDAPTYLTLGKSRVVPLPFPVVRMVVGGRPGAYAGVPVTVPEPGTAAAAGMPALRGAPAAQPVNSGAGGYGVAETEITLISPTELYFLGRRPGAMNVVVQAADGRCLVKDVVVTPDSATLQAALAELVPQQPPLQVRATESGLVLTGTVADTVQMDEILRIAASYTGQDRKLVNLLKVNAPQQVMLEVTIAEVSKNIIDHLDFDFGRLSTGTVGVISGIFGGGAAVFGRFGHSVGSISNGASAVTQGSSASIGSSLSGTSRNSTLLGVDAQQRDGLIRVLAEPNILAVSGQSASFLSGGKIFIPVAQSRENGGTTITLEEKEFGVGLKFTPTVLDGSRINLKLVSEASELQQTGSPFTSFNGVTAILPSMATRRVDTTVQLRDGESFMIAGLIRNNVTGAVDKFPGLGEAPVVGALFRSTEFQNNQTELMFVVTPHLVKPMNGPVALPTENHVPPTRGDVLLRGREEGALRLAPAPTSAAPQAPATPPQAAVGVPSGVARAPGSVAPPPLSPAVEITPVREPGMPVPPPLPRS